MLILLHTLNLCNIFVEQTKNNTTMETKKFIAYYRVSTEGQGLGLDAQRNTIINYINCNNALLLAEYSEKESGKKNDRQQLFNAIAECKRTGATLILAKLDRLSRDVEYLAHLKNNGGFDFFALDTPYFDTLNFYLRATFAQDEREKIAERTKNALQALKQKGVKLGANNGVSHKFNDSDRAKAYEAHTQSANENNNNIKAYHYINLRFAEGAKLVEIANELNQFQYSTPTGRGSWKGNQVKRILQRFANVA